MCVCVYMCVFLLKVRRGIFISRVIRLGHEYLLTRMRIKLQQGLHLVEGFRAAFWSFLSGKWVCGFLMMVFGVGAGVYVVDRCR